MNKTLLVFTIVHVAISLAGILSGFVVLYGFLCSKWFKGWAVTFLATTVATSVTGFFFPFERLLPSHVTGVISLIVLGPTLYAFYARQMAGRWRSAFVIGSVVALYLNVFVLVVQLFLKTSALKALAPTQSEPPFKIAQGFVFAAFVTLGVFSFRRFRPATVHVPGRSGSDVLLHRSRISN